MGKSEWDIWRGYLLEELCQRGVDKGAAEAHMEAEPELYAEWFEDGMLPNQAADFAANILH